MLLAPGHAFTLDGHLSRGLQDLSGPLPSSALPTLHTLEAMAAAEGGLMGHQQNDGGKPRPPLGGLAAGDGGLASHQGDDDRGPRSPLEALGAASEQQLVSDAGPAAVSRPPLTTLEVNATTGSDAVPVQAVEDSDEIAGNAAALEGTADNTPFISARSNRLDDDDALMKTPR